MVIDPKVRQNRIKQMTHLYELITKENEENKEILYKTLKEGIEKNKNEIEMGYIVEKLTIYPFFSFAFGKLFENGVGERALPIMK
jgi:hypothetical protein